MLIEYARKNGRKIGVVVALSKEEIGWSRCHMNLDRFDKQTGIKIAEARAIKHDLMTNAERCADSIKPDFIKMVRRANRYFKPDNSPYGEPEDFIQIPPKEWNSQIRKNSTEDGIDIQQYGIHNNGRD
jgi:hypothetical protein